MLLLLLLFLLLLLQVSVIVVVQRWVCGKRSRVHVEEGWSQCYKRSLDRFVQLLAVFLMTENWYIRSAKK